MNSYKRFLSCFTSMILPLSVCRPKALPYNSQLPNDLMITELMAIAPYRLTALMTATQGATAAQFLSSRSKERIHLHDSESSSHDVHQ